MPMQVHYKFITAESCLQLVTFPMCVPRCTGPYLSLNLCREPTCH